MGYLSEVARRRIAAVLLVVGVALAALAIADVGPFSDPPTVEERAQAAVERFFEAAHDKDFKAVCDQLTSDRRRIVEQRAGSIAAEQGLEGCDQILRAFLGSQLSGTKIAKFVDVRVSGNQAVVDADLKSPGTKRPRPVTLDLFLIKDQWKIADFGV